MRRDYLRTRVQQAISSEIVLVEDEVGPVSLEDRVDLLISLTVDAAAEGRMTLEDFLEKIQVEIYQVAQTILVLGDDPAEA